MARPKTIADNLLGEVRDTVAAKRGATMQELCDEFAKRTGITVCTVTMHRAVKRAGLEPKRARRAQPASPSAMATPKRIAPCRRPQTSTPAR